jgi:hypothetical protein
MSQSYRKPDLRYVQSKISNRRNEYRASKVEHVNNTYDNAESGKVHIAKELYPVTEFQKTVGRPKHTTSSLSYSQSSPHLMKGAFLTSTQPKIKNSKVMRA